MTPFSINLTGSNLQLALTGEITIEHARILAEELKNALAPGCTLEVDAAHLTRLDAAGLQVLLSSALLAAETTLCAPSQAWADAFTRYASPDPFHIV